MIPAREPNCSIAEMEALLGQLQDFESRINQVDELHNPSFCQEYRLFSRYLQWRIEEFNKASREELNSHIDHLG